MRKYCIKAAAFLWAFSSQPEAEQAFGGWLSLPTSGAASPPPSSCAGGWPLLPTSGASAWRGPPSRIPPPWAGRCRSRPSLACPNGCCGLALGGAGGRLLLHPSGASGWPRCDGGCFLPQLGQPAGLSPRVSRARLLTPYAQEASSCMLSRHRGTGYGFIPRELRPPSSRPGG